MYICPRKISVMNTIKALFVACLITLPVLSYGKPDEDIPLIETNSEQSKKQGQRSLFSPVLCVLSENTGVIMLSSLMTDLDADVVLLDDAGNEVISQAFVLSHSPVSLFLNEHGHFSIRITLAYGQEFVGDFTY